MTISLGNVDIVNGKVTYNQLCDGGTLDSSQFATPGKTVSGLRRVTALLQNSLSSYSESTRSCISVLNQVTSFRFQSIGATSQVSFCLDNISLLPSTLHPAGKLNNSCMHASSAVSSDTGIQLACLVNGVSKEVYEYNHHVYCHETWKTAL